MNMKMEMDMDTDIDGCRSLSDIGDKFNTKSDKMSDFFCWRFWYSA